MGGPFFAGDQALGWGESDDDTSLAALQTAFDLGIRFIDTADVYGAGHAETLLGRALRKAPPDVVVATKFGNAFDAATRQVTGTREDPEYIRSAIEASRMRLGRDCIDLVFFHTNDFPAEESEPIFDTLDALAAAGQIGAFGWSTDNTQSATAFARYDGFVAIQHNLNLFMSADDMVATTASNGLLSVARQPLAMGLLSGKYAGTLSLPASDIRSNGPDWMTYFVEGRVSPELATKLDQVREILTADGRTLAQGALAWIWGHSPKTLPIPGVRTPDQVMENFAALEKGPLSKDALSEIETIIR